MSARAINAHQAAAGAVRAGEYPRCFCPNVRCRAWIPFDEYRGAARCCPQCGEANLEAQEFAQGMAQVSAGELDALEAQRVDAQALAAAKEKVWQVYGPKAPPAPPTALQAPATKGGN